VCGLASTLSLHVPPRSLEQSLLAQPMSHGPSQFTDQRAESRKFVARISNTQSRAPSPRVKNRRIPQKKKTPAAPPPSRGWLLPPMRPPAQGRRELPIRSSPTGGNGSSFRPSRLVSRPPFPCLVCVSRVRSCPGQAFLIPWVLSIRLLCRDGWSRVRAAVAAPGAPWRRPRRRHLRREPRHRRRVLRR
jgi:hypothetical protein